MISKPRIGAIDAARAFFSVSVVVGHLGYFWRSSIFDPANYQTHVLAPSDLLNFYVLTPAVPVFFLISNYLFAGAAYDWRSLRQRLYRILILLVFWELAYWIFSYAGWRILEGIPTSLRGWALFVVTGAGTIYYFFFSLIFVTIIAHFAKRMSDRVVLGLFIASVLLVGILPPIAVATHLFSLTAFWDPLNFLPYPFAATLIFRFKDRGWDGRKWGWLAAALTGLAALTAILDWTVYVNAGFFGGSPFAFPMYTRPSLVLLSVPVLIAAITLNIPQNRVIAFMAKHSLALYCLHPFFASFIRKSLPLPALSGPLQVLIYLIITVLACYAVSLILVRFLREELVR